MNLYVKLLRVLMQPRRHQEKPQLMVWMEILAAISYASSVHNKLSTDLRGESRPGDYLLRQCLLIEKHMTSQGPSAYRTVRFKLGWISL